MQNQRIVESFELEETFKSHLVQLPCSEQLHQVLRAPSSLTLGVSRTGHPPPLWVSVPVPHHPHCRKLLPYVLSKSPLLYFETISTCPITTDPYPSIHLSIYLYIYIHTHPSLQNPLDNIERGTITWGLFLCASNLLWELEILEIVWQLLACLH